MKKWGFLRIAQVAPLYESVPPKLYGGTERVVYWLTEELVSRGHQVTLFASGDSHTSAELVAGCARALRLYDKYEDKAVPHIIMLDRLVQRASDFDVIHFHTDHIHFLLSRYCKLPSITTLHGRLDLEGLPALHRCFYDVPVVSISYSQRKPLPNANWIGNVYHGLPDCPVRVGGGRGEYLAFLGRICPEKRVDRAIQIATALGMHLKIAAKVDPADRAYFHSQIEHLLHQPGIEYIGEIGDESKADFLGNAYAYLFPIDWPEPFGLTMIEAMRCGTPVVAFNCGSVPEVMVDGVTGFIVHSVEEAIAATRRCGLLDRTACRQVFQERFTSSRMADEYVVLYEKLAGRRKAVHSPVPLEPAQSLLET
jgi:glycosyltransferase involved in cell wall biosynthesis